MDWIWVIIAVVVGVAKLLGKLNNAGEDEASPEVAPRPVATQRKRPPLKPASETWQADPAQIKQLIEQLTGKAKSRSPSPPPPPKIEQAQPVAAVVERSETAQAVQKTKPATTTRARRTRGSRWSEAFRDRQNLRNIIISTEILGQPRAFRDLS